MNMKSILLAGAIALAPVAASAATVDLSANVANGGTYDVLSQGYTFGVTFADSDTAGVYTFTFENNEAVNYAVVLSNFTTNQFGQNSYFQDGITAAFTGNPPGLSFAMGQSGSGELTTIITAGSSDQLVITFGDPTIKVFGLAPYFNFNVFAVAVPLPAGALLLGTALAGLGLARRKKKAA